MKTVTPAYGRKYPSVGAALAAWNAGKDFVVADASDPHAGMYINKQDADERGLAVRIRFGGNFVVVK